MLASLVLSALLACSGSDNGNGDDDGPGDTDTAPEDTGPEFHPLVPEEYKYTWTVDGCETEDGDAGSKVYVLGEARNDGSGNFEGTEKWYWFWSDEGWEGDCVDTFTISGTYAAFDYADFYCEGCDEGYEIERKLTDQTCSVTYYDIFDQDKQPDEEKYTSILLWDPLTPSGNPNMNNVSYMYNYNYNADDRVWVGWTRYSGHVFPDVEGAYGQNDPQNFDWMGDFCMGEG